MRNAIIERETLDRLISTILIPLDTHRDTFPIRKA
jgi:hypothetical protein